MKKLINVFGAPGSGKSTFALFLTGELKMRGLNAEFAPEYIKYLIAKGDNNFDQFDVLHNQYRQILAFYQNSDIVVTDSPLLLSTIYGREYKHKNELFSLAERFHSEFNNFNILITPPKSKEMYKDSLRLQTYEESLELYHSSFKHLLDYNASITNFFDKTREELFHLSNIILNEING